MKQQLRKTGIRICMAVAAVFILTGMGMISGCKQNQIKNSTSMKELLESKEEIVIDCLGDSITWGMYSTPILSEQVRSGEVETSLDDGGQLFEDYGIYISGSFQSDPTYPEVLEEELNRKLNASGSDITVKTVNDGICGDWITAQTVNRMSCDPDIVVLLMGGNNYYFGYPIEGMFHTALNALKERGIIVYLANYPYFPGEKHVEAFHKANEEIARVSAAENVPLIDLSAAVDARIEEGEFTRPELFSPDHIHLSEQGYLLIGQIAADAVWEDINQ